jgi:Fibronectin type III domain
MNTCKRIGLIGQIVTVIGFAAALSACGDEASSGAASASSASTAAVGTSSSSTPSTTSSSTSSSSSTTSTSSPAPSSEPQSVSLAWTPPTENTDGSALTNLSGYEIYYGTSSSSLTQKISLNSVGLSDYVVENLTAGTWYFQVIAINAAGVQSGPSSLVSVRI